MKKFEQFSRHLEILQRADKEDLENEFIISGILVENILKSYTKAFLIMQKVILEKYKDELENI